MVYSFSSFQISNTVLLPCCTLPAQGLLISYFITGSVYLLFLTTFAHLPPSLCSLYLWVQFCGLFVSFKILYVSEIIQYLSFSAWLISLRRIPVSSIPYCLKWQDFLFFFSYGLVMCCFAYMPHFLYQPVQQWMLRLSPWLGSCKWWGSELEGACISLK